MSLLNRLMGQSAHESGSESNWVHPENIHQFRQILKSSKLPVLLYKHSYRCATCMMTKRTVEDLMEEYTGKAEFIFVDVIQDRELSSEISRISSIRHESPQAILFSEGDPVLDLSHGEIRYNILKEHIDREVIE